MSCVQFINRYTQTVQKEAIYGEAYLRWAYETRLGAIARWGLLTRPIFSKWYGWRMSRPGSAQRVAPFIKQYKLDPAEWLDAPDSYQTFNDFFTRQLKSDARPIDSDPQSIVFPADGRHFAFADVSKIKSVFVKGQSFNIEALIGDSALAKKYAQGSLLLSRLCPVDYHRFHFPAAGQTSAAHCINGSLASVNPIALRKNIAIFWQNKRMITQLDTLSFGTILCLEIGATCVGSIKQTFTPHTAVTKGQEKGLFRFGGSSTILLFEPNRIEFAPDLLAATTQNLELYAHMGDMCAKTLN